MTKRPLMLRSAAIGRSHQDVVRAAGNPGHRYTSLLFSFLAVLRLLASLAKALVLLIAEPTLFLERVTRYLCCVFECGLPFGLRHRRSFAINVRQGGRRGYPRLDGFTSRHRYPHWLET